MDTAALGTRIQQARKRQKISSETLSVLCDVGAVHIRKIESGAKAPSIHTFTKICNALHTSPQYLLQDSLEPNDLSAHIQISDRISKLSKAQANIINSMIDQILE